MLDVLRPSRKENMAGNGRPTGDAGSTVPAARIYNPADRTRTTIREMTENSKVTNMQNQRSDGYIVSVIMLTQLSVRQQVVSRLVLQEILLKPLMLVFITPIQRELIHSNKLPNLDLTKVEHRFSMVLLTFTLINEMLTAITTECGYHHHKQ